MNAIHRIKLFFALSRTPHGILDMATPGAAVLLYLGAAPSMRVVLIGLLTAFAGYTAVYAFNDVVDYRSDKDKYVEPDTAPENYLDSLLVRHPMAQGLLSFKEGLTWAIGWSVVAMFGAWLLNPVCTLIFLAGAALEAVYCLLWRVSPWRAVVSGFVKNMGAVAALFAVDPSPDPAFVILLFACLFFWEIGGQNIPADWTDLDEDRRLRAQTIPVRLGENKTAVLMLSSLLIAVAITILLFAIRFPAPLFAAPVTILLIGYLLLVKPAVQLFQSQHRDDAMALFNKASYFPLSMLTVAVLMIIYPGFP